MEKIIYLQSNLRKEWFIHKVMIFTKDKIYKNIS